MNLRERIVRRQRTGDEPRLVYDYDAINPVVHPDEPTSRGPVLEQLLDHLDSAFEGVLPENGYVWGPKGAGKSAVTTALFGHLSEISRRTHSPILTTTRAEQSDVVEFVYVDAWATRTDFGLYHTVLDALVDEPVPEQGLSTSQLRERLRNHLHTADRDVVVAVDHVGEPETQTVAAVSEALETLSESVAWLAVGQDPPESVDGAPEATVELPAYEDHALVDVLTARTSGGLARHALSHERIREVAAWADGDAHDALSAVFGAADRAMATEHGSVTAADLEAGMADVPRPCISLGRVLALPANRQRVLLALLDIPEERRRSVRATAEAIAASERVDLSATTVKRILYELAEVGVTERVTLEDARGVGRPPSRLEPRFPTYVFRRLSAIDA